MKQKENNQKRVNKKYLYPCYSITRSYNANLQHEYHGGNRFEKSDFFSSHSYSFFCEPSNEQIILMSDILYNRAIEDVEKAMAKKRLEFKVKEMTPEQKKLEQQDEAILSQELELQLEEDETIPFSKE